MKARRGSALVQVLIMSVLLIILATGIMRTMFASHVLVMRVKEADTNRDWVERCFARKTIEWAGNRCAGAPSDSCDFVSIGGPVIAITCQASGRIDMGLSW